MINSQAQCALVYWPTGWWCLEQSLQHALSPWHLAPVNDSLSPHTHRPTPGWLPSVCHSHAHQSVTGTECEMVRSAVDPETEVFPSSKMLNT